MQASDRRQETPARPIESRSRTSDPTASAPTTEARYRLQANAALLYRLHEAAIRSFLGRRCGDPTLVDDLTQDVFEAALRSPRYVLGADPRPALPWLLTVAHRRLVDSARRRRREVPYEEHRDGREASNKVGSRLSLVELLRVLPPPQREVVLRRLAGESYAEIGASMGLNPATCRMCQSRACRTLQRELRALSHEDTNAPPEGTRLDSQ